MTERPAATSPAWRLRRHRLRALRGHQHLIVVHHDPTVGVMSAPQASCDNPKASGHRFDPWAARDGQTEDPCWSSRDGFLDRSAARGWTENGHRPGNDASQRDRQGSQDDQPSLITSQQGMCSLDGRGLIERDDDQRLCWAERMWSPPPESNRRPHPYHSCCRAPVIGRLQVSGP